MTYAGTAKAALLAELHRHLVQKPQQLVLEAVLTNVLFTRRRQEVACGWLLTGWRDDEGIVPGQPELE